MTRYVLRYRGPGRAPVGDVAHIERSFRVVDRGVSQVMAGLPAWVAAEEASIPVPATHPTLQRRPA